MMSFCNDCAVQPSLPLLSQEQGVQTSLCVRCMSYLLPVGRRVSFIGRTAQDSHIFQLSSFPFPICSEECILRARIKPCRVPWQVPPIQVTYILHYVVPCVIPCVASRVVLCATPCVVPFVAPLQQCCTVAKLGMGMGMGLGMAMQGTMPAALDSVWHCGDSGWHSGGSVWHPPGT